LLCSLVGVLPVLIAQSSQHAGRADSPAIPERFLTVEQAAAQFSVSDKWLYRHKRQLPHSQPSRKVLLFPEEKLRRWFAGRKSA
jgi:predicted DNA-binding transcriptional regulator AlpA